ncbi:MAG: FkbM family methyltransferase [Patescibacteria group bacterium]
MIKPRVSYAQNREDIILDGLVKGAKKGFYVDVGANHSVLDSVTKLFYDRGWNGINIEPAHDLCALLKLSRPRDINLEYGVSDKTSELTFREYLLGDGLSTFSDEVQKIYENDEHYRYFAKEYVDHKVPVTTLAKLLKEHAKDKKIDFMKIDVEGYEYEVVAGNDWTKYRPVILCIEANHVVRDWHPMIKDAGYELVFWDGLNEYFVAKEHKQLTKDFSYADSVFLGEPFVSWGEYKTRQDFESEKAILKLELSRKDKEITNLKQGLVSSVAHRDTSKIKRGLLKVDRKLNSMLTTEVSEPAHDVGVDPTTLPELSAQLRDQLIQTKPSRKAAKNLAHKSYGKSKDALKHVRHKK